MVEKAYKKPKRYAVYVQHTDEKVTLAKEVSQQYFTGKLPIRPGDNNKRALDVGCGNGVNLKILKDVFRGHEITGVEQSFQQFQYAVAKAIPQVHYIYSPFQEFPGEGFDFILTSHVLQYIDTNPYFFLEKLHHSLAKEGEAWVVQHTEKGIAEIIKHMMPLCSHLSDWKTFDDYVGMVKELGFNHKTGILNTSLTGINFQNPSEEDKLRLEFILALETDFDKTSPELKQHLAELQTKFPVGKRISHPNGIIKIRK